MANDIPGLGSQLKVKIGGVATLIPQCSEITWDGFSVNERNPTTLQSLNVRKKPGLPNLGEIKWKIFLDPNDTTHQYIRNQCFAVNPVQQEIVLIYADGDTTPSQADVKGFFKEFNQSGIEPETGTLMADMTFAVDTLVGFTAGTP